MLLLSCETCHRQYDVTSLEPGARVRCACDAVLQVGWPRELSGQALACTRCGGAVAVEATTCPYCSAGISEADRRQTTLCPECYTRIDDDSRHCRACGVEIRPQALTPLPAGRRCPRCAGELSTRALDQTDVVECGDCLGIWLAPRTFEGALRTAERASAASALSLVEAPSPSERPIEAVSYIPCLTCGELMNRKQYRHAGRSSGVVIDVCRHHGVWLDHHELERIVEFVRAGSAARVAPPLPDAKAMVRPLGSPRPREGAGPRRVTTTGEFFVAALEGIAELLFWRP